MTRQPQQAAEQVFSDDQYLEWICGYANADGGTLYLTARTPEGDPLALENTAELAAEIPARVRDLLGIEVRALPETRDNLSFLRIEVDGQPFPVSYLGRHYFRRGDSWWTLEGAELERFLLQKQGRHWDAVPLPGLNAEALDAELLANFVRRAERCGRLQAQQMAFWRDNPRAAMEALHLTDGPYLKRAAALLFLPDPEAEVPGACVKIGQFGEDGRLLRQDLVRGGLLEQAGTAFELLRDKYLAAEIAWDGLQRTETPPLPDAALRECITNAIVHKDYGSGATVQVRVYPDRLMLWNPCSEPTDWATDGGSLQQSSRPANPDLARICFLAGLVEAWGSGLERMRGACRDAGLSPPSFRPDARGLWVEFRLAAARSAVKEPVKAPAARSKTKAPAKAVAAPKPRAATAPAASNPNARRILKILRDNPGASRKEIADQIKNLSTEGVKYHLDRLKKAGKIARLGPAHGGRWEIR